MKTVKYYIFIILMLSLSTCVFGENVEIRNYEDVLKYYCGVPVDVSKIPALYALQDSLYNEYKKNYVLKMYLR